MGSPSSLKMRNILEILKKPTEVPTPLIRVCKGFLHGLCVVNSSGHISCPHAMFPQGITAHPAVLLTLHWLNPTFHGDAKVRDVELMYIAPITHICRATMRYVANYPIYEGKVRVSGLNSGADSILIT